MQNRKERRFPKAFALRPTQLTALVDSLELTLDSLRIRVKCRDGSTLQPGSLAAILELPNPTSRAIENIRISGASGTGTSVEMDFDNSWIAPLSYELAGEDGDVVRLSKLIEDHYEPLMQSYSYIYVGPTSIVVGTLLYFLALIIMVFGFNRLWHAHTFMGLSCSILGISMQLCCIFGKVIKAGVFPVASFCIGNGGERYEQAANRRRSLLWAVIVALFVDVLAGLIANAIPHSTQT